MCCLIGKDHLFDYINTFSANDHYCTPTLLKDLIALRRTQLLLEQMTFEHTS